MTTEPNQAFDVIVVGCGVAGLSAAVAAAGVDPRTRRLIIPGILIVLVVIVVLGAVLR